MRNDPEVQRAVHAYQMGLPRMPVAGRSGELLGRGTGSSLEFQEYREYMPGDDIRHLDWSAYARSDTLMVRLYREEISPTTEILLDASKSMTSAGPTANGTGTGTAESHKSWVARQLATLFSLLVGTLGGRPTILPLTDDHPLRPLRVDGLSVLRTLPFEAIGTMPELMEQNLIPLRRQSVRIVISDFLFPHDPAPLIRRLAADASALWVIQLLNAWEANPTTVGGRRLIDLETNSETDIVIGQNTLAEYTARLAMLQSELERNCRRAHAPFVTLIADHGLPALCRNELTAAGMLRAT